MAYITIYNSPGSKGQNRAQSFRCGSRPENLHTWTVLYSKLIQKGRGFDKPTGGCEMHKIYCKICKNWFNSVGN